jgi:hypothetical protein
MSKQQSIPTKDADFNTAQRIIAETASPPARTFTARSGFTARRAFTAREDIHRPQRFHPDALASSPPVRAFIARSAFTARKGFHRR